MRDDTTFASDVHSEEERGISSAARKVSQGLGELGRALSERRQNVVEPASRFIQDQPLAAFGVAFGVGYILGGGLFTRTTGRLLGLTWKLGGMALAKNVLGNLGGDPAGEGI
jgi:ElaB/YqjD/DUF883 family membrane-anchored ribosome-binding protein